METLFSKLCSSDEKHMILPVTTQFTSQKQIFLLQEILMCEPMENIWGNDSPATTILFRSGRRLLGIGKRSRFNL